MTSALISGCSHHNFIKSGQNYFAGQHFELAVAQFEQALLEKPNHQPTIEQLHQAKTALNQWAIQLEFKADQANNAGQQAKAMLLYSKVAQLTQRSHSIEQYNKLYKKLRTESSLQAKLLPNNIGIIPNDLSNINGLTLVTDASSAMQLSFKKSNPVFEIQQSSLTKQTQYISGTQLISNPEFSEIQYLIHHHRDNNHSLRDKLSDTRHHLSQNKNRLNKLNNQKYKLKQQRLNSSLSASDQQKIQAQQKQIAKKISRVKQEMANNQNHADKYKHRLSRNRHELSQLIARLTYTPSVIAAPVYADYSYQVQHQKNSLVAQLYLTHFTLNDTITRVAQVSVSSQDESHPAHPTISLNADPMIVNNQQQLTPLFNIEIKQIARRLLTELVDEKRHQYLALANQAIGIDNKFLLWLKHAMVTSDGALPQIATKIQQSLIMEYGVGGEFNINQLIHNKLIKINDYK